MQRQAELVEGSWDLDLEPRTMGQELPQLKLPPHTWSSTAGAVGEQEKLLEVGGAEQHLGGCSCTRSNPARKLCILARTGAGAGRDRQEHSVAYPGQEWVGHSPMWNTSVAATGPIQSIGGQPSWTGSIQLAGQTWPVGWMLL